MYKNKKKNNKNKKGKGKTVYSSSESANWDDESAIGIGTTPLVAISTAWQMELIYIELLSCLPAAKQVFVHTDWSELESKFLLLFNCHMRSKVWAMYGNMLAFVEEQPPDPQSWL